MQESKHPLSEHFITKSLREKAKV